MTSYYIDPERCFEIPFRIPLPDRDEMATRLANIPIIMKRARERQSLRCAEYRQKLANRPTKYRDKAKAIMKCGRLKRFVGDLTKRYFDYLDFHQESLNDMSPLTIQIPALCSPQSPPPPCLFGPPRNGDFNELIRSNLSWSQFAAPVPAGWREKFFQDRRWELGVERRALDEYSVEERKAEYAALESQRHELGVFLRMESNAPPPLQRKRPIPLPPSPRSPLILDLSPRQEGVQSKRKSKAGCKSPSRNAAAVQQQPPVRSETQRPSFSCRPLCRPSLRIMIPGTECFKPWLSGHLCDSPLSGIGPDFSPPSVLLNADAVRAYLDDVHGLHDVLPRPQSPQLAYPQTPLHQLVPSKLATETSAEDMPGRDIRRHNNRKSLFMGASSTVHASDSKAVPPPSTIPKLHIQQSQSMSTLKRQASQSSIDVSNDSLKKPRLMILTPATTPCSQVCEKECSPHWL